MNRTLVKGATLLITLLGSIGAWALNSDRNQPMHVEADRVTIDDQQKISRYSGDVRLQQGSIRATGNEITVHSNDQGPQRIVVTGSPATFRQRPEGKEKDAHGSAQRIEHDTGSEITQFIGEARFWQGKEEFAGARIEYDASHDRVHAQAGGDGSNRVHIVIQPKNPSDGSTTKATQ